MKTPMSALAFEMCFPRAVISVCAAALSLSLFGCGGGSSAVESAVVTSVAAAKVLEGQLQNTVLEFEVTLSKPVVNGLNVTYSTVAVDKPTGYAKGGSACTAGVDFITVSNNTIALAPGVTTAKLSVTVCADTQFEPNEVLKLSWTSPGAAGGTVEGTILNDDVGGLNGSGSTALLAGLSAYGRDTNALTNDASDGALGFSFSKTSACVLDKVTGLTWQRFSANPASYAYTSAVAYVTTVNSANLCGYSDWRLPTALELMGLMNTGVSSGNIANADYLGVATDAMDGTFWTAEKRAASNTVDAWYVDADSNGAVSFDAQTRPRKVRLVRGGNLTASACSNDGRWTDHQDGTVSDARTGLMWKSCPEGYTNNSCTAGAVITFKSVSAVVAQLTQANGNADKSYSDWRVPTRNELASLVNRACSNPSIWTGIFPNNASLSYLSATPNVNAASTQVWSVDFNEGGVGPGVWAYGFYMRLVRAGQ